jgi:hypothetical protein
MHVVTMNQWLNQKMRPTQFNSRKNKPSLDYASKINETHQKDYVAPLKIEESDNIPCDNRDYCPVCNKEIPPGPDFCSTECEVAFWAQSLDTDSSMVKPYDPSATN